MTKGWCPVHDRILESRDGTCPECGTPLVDLTAGPRDTGEARLVVEEDPSEPVPADLPPAIESSLWPQIRLPERLFGRDTIAIGAPAIATIVIAAVVTSFLVGLAIPRGNETKTEHPSRPLARAEYRVGKDYSAAGLRLRLDRFSQRGRRIVLRVTVPDQPDVPIGRISQVNVAPETASGTVQDEVSLGVRTTVSGFIAEGEALKQDDLPITGIRITQLEMLEHGEGRANLDISHVWPEKVRGPLAVEKTVRVPFPGREILVVGLVGWPDHLDLLMEERGLRAGWSHIYDYTLLSGGADADGEQGGQKTDNMSTMTVVSFHACQEPAFACIPRGLRGVILVVSSSTSTVSGRWAWELA